MKYTNSPLINYTKLSPNYNPRGYNDKIRKITIHHMAGNLSVEQCGNVFAPRSRGASSNYGVDSNGRIGLYVEEKNRSWASSSRWNDFQAVTIEVADDQIGGNWHVSDKALEATIKLCVDICKRNNIKELVYTGDKYGSLTRHNMFARTTCPGPYLQSKFPYIASEVTRRLKEADKPAPSIPSTGHKVWNKVLVGGYSLSDAKYKANTLTKQGYHPIIIKMENQYYVKVGSFINKNNANSLVNKLRNAGHPKAFMTERDGVPVTNPAPTPVFKPYIVRVEITDLNIRKGPGTKYPITGRMKIGNYTIMEEKGGWGRLKSGEGWIALNYTKKI